MIRIPTPPSLNNIFATVKGRRIKTREYKAWLTEAGYMLLSQRPEKHKGDVVVNIRIGPRVARADIDNRTKPVLDLLTKMQVIEDDCRVVSVLTAWANVQGCEITVQPA